jgi:hypothetical protein
MVYALDKESRTLLAFPSPEDAAAHCKPVDVFDGYWLFFAEDGKPLDARFEPSNPADPGAVIGPYTLQQALSGRWLQERLADIRQVQGCGLASIEQLVETWKDLPRKPAAR